MTADTAAEHAPDRSDRRKVMRWGFGIFWLGILLAALLGVLGGAISTLNFQAGEFIAALSGLGGLVVVAGIGVMIYSRFLPKTPVQLPPPRQAELPAAQKGISLPPEYGRTPVSSVTENTTELLDAPSHKERRRSE